MRRTMSRICLVIALAALIFLLVACGDDEPKPTGVITGVRYDDDDSYYQPQIGQVPGYWVNEPERFLIETKDAAGKSHDNEVSEGTYERASEANGDCYDPETNTITSRETEESC